MLLDGLECGRLTFQQVDGVDDESVCDVGHWRRLLNSRCAWHCPLR
jgi:hypothetical protein